MKTTLKVLKNTSFLTISEIVMKVLGLLWIIFLTRELTVELYGRYSFVNSIMLIFLAFPNFGFGLTVVRDLAQIKKNAEKLLSTMLSLTILLIAITVVGAILFTFITGYSDPLRNLIYIALLSLIATSLRHVPITYFEAMEHMAIVGVLNVLNTLLLIVGGFVAYMQFGTLESLFFGMFVGVVVSTLVAWGKMVGEVSMKLSFDITLMKQMFVEAFPLGLASLSYLIYTRIDTVVLHTQLGDVAVGTYNGATPFVYAFIQLVNVPFAMSLYPTLSRVYAKSSKRFRKILKKSSLYVLLWSIPAALIVSWSASLLIPFVFGQKFAASIPILEIIIFIVPISALSALLYKALIILKKLRVYLYVHVFGAITGVLLQIMLISQFGLIGAAYALVATQALVLVLLVGPLLQLRKKTVI